MAQEHSTQHNPAEHHPGAALYIKIGIALVVLTAFEVGVFYFDINSALMTFILLGLSTAKFVLVVGFFMHLKFDDRRFLVLFAFPMVVMLAIATALLGLFMNFTR